MEPASTSAAEYICPKLPGFGFPRDHKLKRGSLDFPNILTNGFESSGVTLCERAMLGLINAITDKPEWERKVFDEGIVEKWRDEALGKSWRRNEVKEEKEDKIEEKTETAWKKQAKDRKGSSLLYEEADRNNSGVRLTPAMWDFCLAELRDKAEIYAKTGFVDVLDAEWAVAKSDSAVSAELAAALREHVKPLENVPEAYKDWHPGTKEQVLDLVHPSLFPVVFGRTRVLGRGRVPLETCEETAGSGELTTTGLSKRTMTRGIDPYQWLPADVEFDKKLGGQSDEQPAGRARITSYINNLHPGEHKALYGVLEKMVDAAVPLWQESLWYHDRRRIQFPSTDDEEDFYVPKDAEVTDPMPPPPGGGPLTPNYFWSDAFMEWQNRVRVLKDPKPRSFKPFSKLVRSAERVNLREQYPQGLQVIFKLANIHLTPEQPVYEGGSWHVEGTLSEAICASAIYYYDEDNITSSELAFRQAVAIDEVCMIPEQGAFASFEKYYGVVNDESAVQNLGSVLTRQGRMLAFPNVMQHRVGSFELVDKSRAGHRKILAMFLVDPSRRILSSANVPPQQMSWWAPKVRAVPAFGKLPAEIFENILSQVDTLPITWEEALRIRRDLMRHRSGLDKTLNEDMHQCLSLRSMLRTV